jgi:hypothetical protein
MCTRRVVFLVPRPGRVVVVPLIVVRELELIVPVVRVHRPDLFVRTVVSGRSSLPSEFITYSVDVPVSTMVPTENAILRPSGEMAGHTLSPSVAPESARVKKTMELLTVISGLVSRPVGREVVAVRIERERDRRGAAGRSDGEDLLVQDRRARENQLALVR